MTKTVVFLRRSEGSSEEFEYTDENDVAKGKNKQKLDLHSSSQKIFN
jgi:hypothetical protein